MRKEPHPPQESVNRLEELGFDPRLPKRLEDHFQRKYLATDRLPGYQILVARHGQTALSMTHGSTCLQHSSPLRPDAIFRIYSMTKAITSVALMQLYEQGHFLLEDPIGCYLPELNDLQVYQTGSWPNYITTHPDRQPSVRDLLCHTSGLTYDFMRRTNVDYGYRKDGLTTLRNGCDLAEFISRLAQHPLEFTPGKHWNYSVSTDVCGRLIEVLSGQTLDSYLQQHIFTPLQMADTGFQVPAEQAHRLPALYEYQPNQPPRLADPEGPESIFTSPAKFLSGGGGLVSTAQDYLQFLSMLLAKGTLNQKRIIGQRTLEYMVRNHLPEDGDLVTLGTPSGFSEAPYSGVGFGLGFAVMMNAAKCQMLAREGEFFWGGMASTAFWVNPTDQMVVIFMTQLMPSSIWPVRRELHAMIQSAVLDV